jgi:hypothetical protein
MVKTKLGEYLAPDLFPTNYFEKTEFFYSGSHAVRP